MLPEPEIIHSPERKLLALSSEFTLDTRTEIPSLWNDFWSREWKFPGEQEQAAYGASYAAQSDGRFSYAVGINITPLPKSRPDDTCVVTLSEGTYAVFKKRGPVQEIPTLFDEIFSKWLPNSGKSQREGAVFERYPYEEDGSAESMSYQIWVPVND